MFKIKNLNKLPDYVSNTTFDFSKNETGKESRQHRGIKLWHYFKGMVETDSGIYEIVVNVRDKGDRQFVYEVSIR